MPQKVKIDCKKESYKRSQNQMNEQLRDKYIKGLDSLIESYLKISIPDPESVVYDPDGEPIETGENRLINSFDLSYSFIIQAVNVISKICPANSIYLMEAYSLYDHLENYGYKNHFRLYLLLLAIRDDLKSGFIGSLSSLLHQEIFADYLDMAQHLLDQGYKDAAAVIAGSTLESHLRQLCLTNQIDVDEEKKDGSKQPKKASIMNADLKRGEIYNLYDHKMVTARLDLRNNAAHGKYDLYTNEQVENFIHWLRDFIERVPA
jgi:hypothetical protein